MKLVIDPLSYLLGLWLKRGSPRAGYLPPEAFRRIR
jgi:hypothetical protein